MNNLYSALKQVFKARWINFTKVIVLALGITISSALLCRVAWEQSYDTFWSDVDNLHQMQMNFQNVEEPNDDRGMSMQCFPALAPEIQDKLSSVTAATRFQKIHAKAIYKIGERDVSLGQYKVDSSFVDVFDITIIEGESAKQVLSSPSSVMISRRAAEKISPEGSALGTQIMTGGKPYTITAIFEDIPRNSTINNVELIQWRFVPMIWDGNDSWHTYIRTVEGTTDEQLSADINELLAPRYADWEQTIGQILTFRTRNITAHFAEVADDMDLIMSVLAIGILLIAGLNFALLSISSLTSRAKEVGVRKAAGSSTMGIFSLIIFETIIYIILALIVAATIMWVAKPQLETIMGLYADVFSLGNLWAVGVVLVLLIMISGVIPAIIFARIPVTQVFQSFVAGRSSWKKALLFVQFTCSILIICFMFIIDGQYRTMANFNVGYDQEKLLIVELKGLEETQINSIINDVQSHSGVQSTSLCDSPLFYGLSGQMFSAEKGGSQRSARILLADTAFFKTFGIDISEGVAENRASVFGSGGGDVVVSREFLPFIGIEGNPVGALFYTNNAVYRIAGVCDNFQTSSALGLVQPVVIYSRQDTWSTLLVVRSHSVTKELMQSVQKTVDKFYPTVTPPTVKIYRDELMQNYSDTQMFKDGVIVASIILLIITIMGITGYVGIETKRRSKEIAIRKVHGSTAREIIILIIRSLLIIVVIASAVAIPLAYILGGFWQSEFTLKVPLSWIMFAGGTIIIATTVLLCATAQSWKIATSNPARSIKSE